MPIEFIEWLCSEVLRLLVGTGAERAKISMGFLPGSLCEKKYFRSASFSDRKGIVTGSYCGGSGLTKTSFYHMLCLIIF